MTTYDEMLARLRTTHMFFGDRAVQKGEELLVKYAVEGVITQEEFEKLSEENRTMKCDEVWTGE